MSPLSHFCLFAFSLNLDKQRSKIFLFARVLYPQIDLLLPLASMTPWQSRPDYIQGALLIGQWPEPTRSCLQVHEPGQPSCHVELSQGIMLMHHTHPLSRPSHVPLFLSWVISPFLSPDLSSFQGAAFGFHMIAAKAGEQMAPFLPQLVPRLYRYQFDPNLSIRQAMTSIWDALVTDKTLVGVESYATCKIIHTGTKKRM